jgi:hypothetical protein
MSRVRSVVIVASVAWGVMAAAASAASIDTLGPQGEAVEDSPWVLAASGQSERALQFFANIKPAGGRGCGANAATDDGMVVATGQTASGAWTAAVPTVELHTPNPGDYLVCAWLQEAVSEPAVAAKSTVVHARQGSASLKILPPARSVRPGSPLTVRFQGVSELAREVYATIKPAHGAQPCGAGFDADVGGESFLFWEDVHGAFDFSHAGTVPDRSGRYRVCAWVAEVSSDLQPEAAAEATFTAQSCARAKRAYRVAQRRLARARTRRARRQRRKAVSRARANVRAVCGT